MREYSGMHSEDAAGAARRLWDDHKKATFPRELRGREIAGIDPVLLDADIAGCVAAWIADGGPLDTGRRAILARSVDELDQLVAGLADANERLYFKRLRDLAGLALGQS